MHEEAAIPYPADHKLNTRTRILDSARRLFNRNGLSAVSIDDIMAGAGLTRGGFYSHFSSKEELYVEAITHFGHGAPRPDWQKSVFETVQDDGRSQARAILDAYLSREHAHDLDGPCPLIGLATDVARSGSATKTAYRQVMAMMAGIFAANLGPSPVAPPPDAADPASDAQRALAVVAMCVGAMVLARAVDDDAIADGLRTATRTYASALAGWTGDQAVPVS